MRDSLQTLLILLQIAIHFTFSVNGTVGLLALIGVYLFVLQVL